MCQEEEEEILGGSYVIDVVLFQEKLPLSALPPLSTHTGYSGLADVHPDDLTVVIDEDLEGLEEVSGDKARNVKKELFWLTLYYLFSEEWPDHKAVAIEGVEDDSVDKASEVNIELPLVK